MKRDNFSISFAIIFLNEMKVSDIAYCDNIEKDSYSLKLYVDQYLLNYFKLFKYILIDHNFLQKILLCRNCIIIYVKKLIDNINNAIANN